MAENAQDADETSSLLPESSVGSAVDSIRGEELESAPQGENKLESSDGSAVDSIRGEELDSGGGKTGLRNRKCKGSTSVETGLKLDEGVDETLGSSESCSEVVDTIDEIKYGCSEIVEIFEETDEAEPFVSCTPVDAQTCVETEELTRDDARTEEGTVEEEKPQRREVYRMPNEKTSSQDNNIVFWPANFIILAVAWQVRSIIFICSAMISSFMFLYELALDPVQKTADVKKHVSEHLSGHMKHMVTGLGPRVGELVKRVGWGILAVTYVGLVLSFLVVPVIFVEYYYVTKYIEEPVDISAPLFFNYTEARPSAMLSLTPYVGGPGEDVPAHSWNRLHATVKLTLPESDYNRQLGMFQVAAELVSVKNEILLRSSRPCMLRFQSVPIRYAKTLIYSVPVLLDVTGEYQLLQLDVIELRQKTSVAVGGVKVYLEPRAGFPPGAGLPELYASEIRVRSELPWSKSLMHKWKRTIYVWTATVLFIGEVSIVLCCFRQVLLPKRKKQLRSKSFKHQEVPPAMRKVKSQTKKRVSFQETEPEVWL